MNKKTILYIAIAAVAAFLIWWFFIKSKAPSGADVTAKVIKGRFDMAITVTGELRSKNQTDITVPMGLRTAGVWQIKINDLVAEGSMVKPGDYVASLDKTEVMSKLNEGLLEMQKKESEYNQNQLDTTISLREARDELVNYEFELKQKQLEKEQSQFEAPSIQQQVDIAYDKAARALAQKKDTYKDKVAQAKAKMGIVSSDLSKAQNKFKTFQDLMGELTITSPKAGMIIYAKEWNGRKKVVGTTVGPWDPEVANVPDLSEMEVISYVNEVDIQKVKTGQKVMISLDADPTKRLEGKVKGVASIGEQRPNQNSKVFEVVIDVLTKDSTLRPSMTTSCDILFGSFDEAIMVPVEAVNVSGDKSYVFKKDGNNIIRQQVLVEATNSKDAKIQHGLAVGETVYLKDISDTANMKWTLLDASLTKPTPAPKDTGGNKDTGAKNLPGGSNAIIIEEGS